MENSIYRQKNEMEQALIQSILEDTEIAKNILEGKESTDFNQRTAEEKELKTKLLSDIANDTATLIKRTGSKINTTETEAGVSAVVGLIDNATIKIKEAQDQGLIVDAKNLLKDILKTVGELSQSVPSMEPMAKVALKNGIRDMEIALFKLDSVAKSIDKEANDLLVDIFSTTESLSTSLKDVSGALKNADPEQQYSTLIQYIDFFNELDQSGKVFSPDDLEEIEKIVVKINAALKTIADGNILPMHEYANVKRASERVHKKLTLPDLPAKLDTSTFEQKLLKMKEPLPEPPLDDSVSRDYFASTAPSPPIDDSVSEFNKKSNKKSKAPPTAVAVQVPYTSTSSTAPIVRKPPPPQSDDNDAQDDNDRSDDGEEFSDAELLGDMPGMSVEFVMSEVEKAKLPESLEKERKKLLEIMAQTDTEARRLTGMMSATKTPKMTKKFADAYDRIISNNSESWDSIHKQIARLIQADNVKDQKEAMRNSIRNYKKMLERVQKVKESVSKKKKKQSGNGLMSDAAKKLAALGSGAPFETTAKKFDTVVNHIKQFEQQIDKYLSSGVPEKKINAARSDSPTMKNIMSKLESLTSSNTADENKKIVKQIQANLNTMMKRIDDIDFTAKTYRDRGSSIKSTPTKKGKGLKYSVKDFLRMNDIENRAEVLTGSIASGNNNPEIKKELKSLN